MNTRRPQPGQDNDVSNSDHDSIDPEVRAAYRALPATSTPDALDRAVLAKAHGAAPQRRGTDWFRPLAFAATVLLGVALLFEMQVNAPDGLESLYSTDPAADAAEPASESASPAAAQDLMDRQPAVSGKVAPPVAEAESVHEDNAAGRQRREQTATQGGQMERGRDADSFSQPAAAAPAALREQVAAPRIATPQQQPENDATDSAAMALSPAETRRANQDQAEAKRSSTASRIGSIDTDVNFDQVLPADCPPERIRDPEAWWHCVAALKANGYTAEAATELEQLEASYPDFSAPE